MHRVIYNSDADEISNIINIVIKIPHYKYMYFLPKNIEEHNKNISILNYENTSSIFSHTINKRDALFYKKQIDIALSSLHEHNIFFYFNYRDLYIHRETHMPVLQNFSMSFVMEFSNKERREKLIAQFAKPIVCKDIPFSLFFFHFVCFSLYKQNTDKRREVSIYELYDNNESLFMNWNKKELDDVEHIVKHGRTYEGIFDYYITHKNIWFHWDKLLLEMFISKYI